MVNALFASPPDARHTGPSATMGSLCISKESASHLIWIQAWVFGALDDEDRAPIYWTNALVYLLPWLGRGFELDRFSIVCLIAGVIHIQVC